jgi:hypothetical protein
MPVMCVILPETWPSTLIPELVHGFTLQAGEQLSYTSILIPAPSSTKPCLSMSPVSVSSKIYLSSTQIFPSLLLPNHTSISQCCLMCGYSTLLSGPFPHSPAQYVPTFQSEWAFQHGIHMLFFPAENTLSFPWK